MAEAKRLVALHNAHPRLRLSKREIERAVSVLDAHAVKFSGGCPNGELSVAFLTDEALAQVHADFMKDPTTTDVITFEGDPVAGQAGEICVSVDTAARYVGLNLSFRPSVAKARQFHEELALYLIHGWLHLAGYDDLQPKKKRRMRAAEKRALTLLRANRAMPSFRIR